MKNYVGEYSSEEQFAYELINGNCKIPKYLRPFLNYQEIAGKLLAYECFDVEVCSK